jgi:hypothetical protein
MATLKDMVDEVRANLAGYTMRQDRITYLANANGITTTSNAITIGSSSNLAKGVIEIDDELIWIDSFNKTSSVLNVIPGFGRGFQGTNPAPHAQYAQVTLSPTFPRVTIKQAINDTINSLFPKLWAINSTTFYYNSAKITYALPDDCQEILGVSWETTGSTREWLPVRKWRMDAMANVASFGSTSTISIYDDIQAGRTVQVWYTTEPNTLESNTEDFADITGLPESCRDVVTLGASYKLLSYLDAGRINLTSAEADAADSKLPSQAGTNSAKYIFALYQQRLNEEAGKLQGKYPVKLHYTIR